MSWQGRSTYRPRPRRYVEPPEMNGPMLPEQFSDEVERPKPEEGEPATQSQDPAPAQQGEDDGASAGQVAGVTPWIHHSQLKPVAAVTPDNDQWISQQDPDCPTQMVLRRNPTTAKKDDCPALTTPEADQSTHG
ncbi:G antigen 10-like isoform X1 [Symphalangus syndactylus]|uniref:G antigen 10-like isoform X1 n=1 Tax=Symphalangus syndactylus TaxID=9590 RepID=UPI0030067D03